MQYISTRGQAPSLNFQEAVLAGLATDGGLYVPQEMPKFTLEQIDSWSDLTYSELALKVIQPFVGDEIPAADLKLIIDKAYANFSHTKTAPLVKSGNNEWVLELFHGPTLAFKDFALQFLGHLLDYILAKRQQRVVVMGATSGDTGSAAIEGCRRCDNIDIFILHPNERVSEVQRRQMTTVSADNVFNIALDGNFDDCQTLVKESFKDQSFLPEGRSLAAVNSINWARIMAQIVYYFHAYLSLGSSTRAISFSVPTGNFGDIYAGYLAKSMGLPVEQLVIATNQNDILHRCLSENDHSKRELHQSLSPSMDIMVSSNFERLLFDLYQRDGDQIRSLMSDFEDGYFLLQPAVLDQARKLFSSFSLNDEGTLQTIAQVYKNSKYLVDPHTAIGVAAARAERWSKQTPMVCLATAHPAKFPESIEQARRLCDALPEPNLPAHMQDLFNREEQFTVITSELSDVQSYMTQNL